LPKKAKKDTASIGAKLEVLVFRNSFKLQLRNIIIPGNEESLQEAQQRLAIL